jgi:hypothetical protein
MLPQQTYAGKGAGVVARVNGDGCWRESGQRMYSWLLHCGAEEEHVRAAAGDLLLVTAMVGRWGARTQATVAAAAAR